MRFFSKMRGGAPIAHAQGAGNALDLDAGAGEHLRIPHSASLDINGSTLTVEAWIFPESYPESFPTVMAKFNSASSWEFDIKNDNTVEWELFTTAQGVCNGGAIALGQWTHIAGTYDGTDLRVYVNGIEVAACAHGAPGPVGTNARDVEIGSRTGGIGGYFDGKIDEARIWNVARSEAQIRDTMCRSLAADESSGSCLWSLLCRSSSCGLRPRATAEARGLPRRLQPLARQPFDTMRV